MVKLLLARIRERRRNEALFGQCWELGDKKPESVRWNSPPRDADTRSEFNEILPPREATTSTEEESGSEATPIQELRRRACLQQVAGANEGRLIATANRLID